MACLNSDLQHRSDPSSLYPNSPPLFLYMQFSEVASSMLLERNCGLNTSRIFFGGGGVGLFISLGSHNSNVLNSLSSDVCYTNKQINNQKTLPVIQTNGEKWIYEDMIEQSKSS